MIFFLEDDDNIRELVVYSLNHSDLEAKGFEKPSDFWPALGRIVPELILLDIMLPEEDGLQILKKLRAEPLTREIPVIMLTAKGNEYDKVIGFEYGADDYVSKPFGMMELIARIKAIMRRTRHEQKTDEYRLGALYLCPLKHLVSVNGRQILLTAKEFDMLCLFMQNKGVVFSRDQLLNRVWGYAFDRESRTVDVHVRTLRQKLGDAGNLIETVRGVGYKIGDAENE